MSEKSGNTTKQFIAAKAASGPLPTWDAPPAGGMTLKPLDPDLLDPNPEQARKVFDEDELFETATSILAQGLLMPISVSPIAGELGRPTGRFHIVAGERRTRSWRMLRNAAKDPAVAARYSDQARKHFGEGAGDEHAARWHALGGDKAAQAKYAAIPAIVEATKDSATRLLDGLTENLIRQNLTALDEADGFARAVMPVGEGGAGLTTEQLSQRFAKDGQYIRRRLQLAAVPALIRKAMSEGVLCTKRDDDGKVVKRGEGSDATEMQERRTIEDISVALELAKLFAQLTKGLDAPQQKKARVAAEERFANILNDALSRRWSVRKIEEVRKELAENSGKRARKADAAATEKEGGDAPKKPAWSDDEKTLSVRRDRLVNLSGEDKAQLRTRLEELLKLLA